MEGLIKGLVNVAIDAIADDDHSNQQPVHHEDRSTWAQVVSGGGEEKENHEEEIESDYGRRRHQQSRNEEESEGNDGGDWEVVGGRKHQQHQQKQEYQEESEGGDWEVVGGRKQQHQQHNQHPLQKTPAHKVVAEGWNEYKRPPSEQTYNDDATHGVDTEPTREELNDLSQACNKLWELDLNRLVPGKDYEIDCGRGKKVYQEGDVAHATLFSWLGDDVFRRPTFSRFCSLLDNYNPHEGYKEDITPEEKNEQTAFIEAISRTAPIKYLYNYLTSKNIISPNFEDFKRMLSRLWFELYGRGGTHGCSSAFEHVFVGEIKGRGENEEVSGFHNWVQFYLEEAKGRVDYQGYIFPRRRGESPDSETQLLTVQFEWNGVLKSVSSTLVGVSPEFEVALYTLCYFVGGEDNHVCLGPYPVNIKCYRIGNDRIGSAFPISEC